ncbi:MAG: uracil-DNA glycosylase, partial [Akkermansiaceae bacterium]|nr:uracil-DNA glycosylase [Akkermansiaceae bacterium]
MPTVVDYLRQLEQRGVTHVRLDDKARTVLREIYRAGQADQA